MYAIKRLYSDLTSVTENADTIGNVFSACAIYVEDPDCIRIKAWNTNNDLIVIDYWKE